MDVLGDALSAMRVGRPSLTLVAVEPSWKGDVEPFDGARFSVVTAGSIRVAGSSLVAGDAVLLPHGTAHTLENSPRTPWTAPRTC